MRSVKVNLKENGTILFACHVCVSDLTDRATELFVSPRTDLLGENGDGVESLTRGVAGLRTDSGEQR
jgi:hypothetical protein